jgi:serine-type D-Ala-D-Ala carboxypeptidase/endopeptidase
VPPWVSGVFAGAGALRSTAEDLLRFLDAWQGKRNTSLNAAMAGALAVRGHTNQQDQDAAAGWFVLDADADELVWKDGAADGYASYTGNSTHTHVAIILLSNTRSRLSTPLLGRHLLNPAFMAPALREPIDMDPARLAAYAGMLFLIAAACDHRNTTGWLPHDASTGQMETESDTNFFVRDSRAVVAFELDLNATCRNEYPCAYVIFGGSPNDKGEFV